MSGHLPKYAAAAALTLGSAVYAQSIAKTCPQSAGGLCFSLNIPDTTAKSSGSIFFQISAPTSLQWVALGQGSEMSGANMFVMYTSADGNVTVSPRLGTGHSEPDYDTAAQITLLDGSGVSGSTMTANLRCDNCQSWSGGSMDFTATSGNFICAWKSGSSLNSNDMSESIDYHDGHSSFAWNFAKAQGGNSQNPFVASSAGSTSSATSAASAGSTGTKTRHAGSATKTLPPCTSTSEPVTQTLAQPSGSGCPTAWPTEFSSQWPTARPTWAASCYPSGASGPWPTNAPWNNDYSKRQEQACDDGSGSSNSDSSTTGSSDPSSSANSDSGDDSSATFTNTNSPFNGNASYGNKLILIHGVLAALAFVALFPIGGLLIRITSLSLWIHAAFQIVALLIYIVAFGMGIYIAMQTEQMNHAHPIIGIVLFIMLIFQPVSGQLHHRLFVKYGQRTGWSWEHLGMGRIAILLGIVNGGLGIQLAGDVSQGGKIAYAVCGIGMAVLYLAGIVFGELKRRRNQSSSYARSQMRQSRRIGSEDGEAPIALTEHFGSKKDRR